MGGSSQADLEARLAELERRLAERRGSRSLPALAAALVLTALAVPLAIAGEGGDGERTATAAKTRGAAVQIQQRNRSRGETGLIANNNGYALRLSNVKRGRGGGAVFGCRAASGTEACLYGDNLAGGQAFLFRSRGAGPAGQILTSDPNAAPFTTNATGVATGLNADKVDGLDAADLRGQRGPQGPPGPPGPQGPPGPTTAATSAHAGLPSLPPASLNPGGVQNSITGSATITMPTSGRLLLIASVDLLSVTCGANPCEYELGLYADRQPVANSRRLVQLPANGSVEKAGMTLMGVTGELEAGQHELAIGFKTTGPVASFSREYAQIAAIALGG